MEYICIGNGRDNCGEGIGGEGIFGNYDCSPDVTKNASCSDDTELMVRATGTRLMLIIFLMVMVETVAIMVLMVIIDAHLMELRMLRVLMILQ